MPATKPLNNSAVILIGCVVFDYLQMNNTFNHRLALQTFSLKSNFQAMSGSYIFIVSDVESFIQSSISTTTTILTLELLFTPIKL